MAHVPSFRRPGFLALLLGMTLSWAARGGAGVWTSGGPYGGDVHALAIDPTSPATLYAGTRQGVFKSTDSGGTWFASGLRNMNVYALGIDPARPGRLYAGAFPGGLLKSTDGGATWAASSAGLSSLDVLALAISPASPATLYAGTWAGGISRSTDAGSTWTPSNSGLTSLDVGALAIDPASPTTLYAGTYSGGFKSTDSGGTWADTGLGNRQVNALVIDPNTTAALYVGTPAGIFRSSDAGATWVPVNTGLENLHVGSLAIDPTNPAALFAGTTGGGVFKSTDFGNTWARSGLTSAHVATLALDPRNTATLYVGTFDDDGGVLKSTDAGDSWAAANLVGLTGVRIDALVIGPNARGTLYAGGDKVGVFKSTDAGDSWSGANLGLTNRRICVLAADPMASDTLFAGTCATVDPGALFKSTDAGGSWVRSDSGLTVGCVASLAIDPLNSGTLFAGTDGANGYGGIFKSTDGGGSWTLARPFPGAVVAALAIDPANPGILYAGVGASAPGYNYGWVYKSSDAGTTWADTGLYAPVGSLAIDPTNVFRLYAGTWDRGIFASTDSGGSWSPASTGLANRRVSALTIDPSNPTTLYAGTDGAGVFKSTNAGATWSLANPGLAGRAVAALALSPAPTMLYAGLLAGSVWQASPSPAAFIKGDLDGDGLSDLVFRSTVDASRNKVWFMDGVMRAGEAPITPDAPSADWEIRGVDDFGGHGRNDLALWNRATGQVEFWLMNATARVGAPVPLGGAPVLDPGWQLSSTADFDHDGRPDVVWRNSTSQKIVIWSMNGTVKCGNLVPTPERAVNANWTVVATRDYNDDGNTDFLWYNVTSGKIVTWYMDASVARTSGQFTSPEAAGNYGWKVVASSDYSRGDQPGTPPLGASDIVWRNETSGNQVVWHMDFASTRLYGEFTIPAANNPPLDWALVGPR